MEDHLLQQWKIHQRVLTSLREQACKGWERGFVEEGQRQLSRYCQAHNVSSALTLPSPTPSSIPLTRTSPPILTSVSNDKRRLVTPLGPETTQHTRLLELVPIRLDLDADGYKLRDSFTWNLHEESLSMETLAAITCRDFDLPLALFVPLIVKAIQEQVDEYREAAQLTSTTSTTPITVSTTSSPAHSSPFAELRGIRALIRLDVTVGFLQLTDQFEWDLGSEYPFQLSSTTATGGSHHHDFNTLNDPLTFAQHYCRELGLNDGEWTTAIANDILEQVVKLRRALLVIGFTRDPRTGAIRVPDPDLQTLILPPAKSLRREPNALNTFSPVLTEYDPLEMERLEQSRDREARRKRRQTRGRRAEAAKLTTVEAPKTMRTPLSYRGSLHRVASRTAGDDDDAEGGFSTVTTTTGRSGRGRRGRGKGHA